MRKFHFTLVLTAVIAALSMGSCGKKTATETPLTVSVEGGLVQGVALESSACVVFKGIPYAAPPTGELRWREPQPVQPWDTVMLCDHFRNAAPQPAHNPQDGQYGTEFFAEDAPFSEDCLQLNIWVPKSVLSGETEPAAVALWIHGGAYSAGWSFEPEMDGEAWAERGVILVTANYRLGIFGYLSHPWLTAESGTSGNYGLMDQIAALKWVRNNISAFGGDPERIMIFGQSAGGGSIRCMTISPESKGLFSSAIVMSAGGLGGLLAEGMSQEDADAIGKRIIELGGWQSLEEMRAATTDELEAALNRYRFETGNWMALCPHIDGKYIIKTFDQSVVDGSIANVPYMMGSVANDMPGLDAGFQPFADERERFAGAPVYLYRFDAPLPNDGRPCLQGSFHSSELWYIFHTLDRSWRPFGEADEALSNRMVDAWTNFAKSGNPGWAATSAEKPYTEQFTR